jgi:hypothetical protein
LIETVKGTTAVSVYAETECDMNKTGNPFYGATKKNWIAGIIGFDYGNSVNNQLGREGQETDFIPQPHKWAILPENGCRCLRQNKDRSKTYLWIKVQSSETPTYHFEGKEVSKETIAPFLKEHSKPHTQANVEKEIVARTVALANILAIKIKGEEYVIAENVADHVKSETTAPVNV